MSSIKSPIRNSIRRGFDIDFDALLMCCFVGTNCFMVGLEYEPKLAIVGGFTNKRKDKGAIVGEWILSERVI